MFCENPIGENETYNKVCSIIEEGKLPSELQNTDVGVIYNNPEFGVQYSLLGVTKTIDVARIKAQNQLMRVGKQFPLLTSGNSEYFFDQFAPLEKYGIEDHQLLEIEEALERDDLCGYADGDWSNETIEEMVKVFKFNIEEDKRVIVDDDGKVMNIGKIRNYLKKNRQPRY